MPGAVAGPLVPWAPHVPPSSAGRGCEAPCSTSGQKAVEAMKKEGSWGDRAMRGAGRGAGHCPGQGSWQGGRAAGLGCLRPRLWAALRSPPEGKQRKGPFRPKPSRSNGKPRQARPRGLRRDAAQVLWLSQMSSYSSLLEPRFKEWLRWNKIVLGNKVNTLRTFLHFPSPQKAAWTMIIKFTMRVKSWPSLLDMGFSCRHSPLGIYLAWGIIYLASRNLCTVVMNLALRMQGSGLLLVGAVSQDPFSITVYFLPIPRSLIINIIICNNGLSEQITLVWLAFTISWCMLKAFIGLSWKLGMFFCWVNVTFQLPKGEKSLYI